MRVTVKQPKLKDCVTGHFFRKYVMSHSYRILRMKVLPFSMALALNITPAFAELPIPSANFIHAGDAAYLINGNNLTINQASDRTILNWQSFNVSAGSSVTFNQPDSSAIALNRIFQNDPSRILGSINANGQIYLYNQNGFIFGEGVRFNANNIVATTLNVDDDLFMQSSVLNAIENNQPAFFDTTGNNIGKITIKPGAEITAESILMIAPEIVNEGVLNSADGQAILAASKDKVYLAASDKDSDLRGLLVEVGTGGTVTNAGSINAARGNVTLIGYAVNQNGRIRATTSVDKNGSIRLLARDNAILFENNNNNFIASKDSIGVDKKPTASSLALAQGSGQVTLGENSYTEIAVDNDTISKVPDAQTQLVSKVEVVGQQVWLKANSKIIAPSGEVKITATESPNNSLTKGSNRNDSYIVMDEGSIIDVAGTNTAILPMERNTVAVEVRSNELADAPLQRESVLQGQTVYVDLRKGTELLNYRGAVATVEKTVAERLASGGDINIRSEGDFIQRDGALLDVSGGKVTFEDGFINETRLVSQGQVVNISVADKFRQYDGILGLNTKIHNRWAVTESFSGNNLTNGRFVTGFEEGKAAGRINITAAATLLASDGVKANTILGPYQNKVGLLPATGELAINLAYFTDSAQRVSFVLSSALDEITNDIAKAPNGNDLLRDNIIVDLILPDRYLSDSGLGKLTLNTFNEIVIEHSATLEARAGSEINLSGSTVIVNGDIVNHAGRVNLSAVPVNSGGRADLMVAENAQIDVSGYWVNNSQFANKNTRVVPGFVDGGEINLSAEGDLSIGKGASLNASAGALLDTDFNVSAGQGGDISLIARHQNGSTLAINGSLTSYALAKGGTLHLEAASVRVSDTASATASADANQLILNSKVFENGGFSRYEITANAGDLVIDAGITPVMKNRVFNQDSVFSLPLIATGTAMADITRVTTRVNSERQAVDLDFTLQQTVTDATRNLMVTDQAVINVDPGAQLSLNTDTRLFFGGRINAPAADIHFAINAPATETGFLGDQAIWLADGSVIDASSTAVYEKNDQGLRFGEIFDAGRVSFEANRGYVVIEEGARIDVSATTETVDVLVKNAVSGSEYQALDIAPDAGQINITAVEGVVIDGQLVADAASTVGAKGGDFSLTLDMNSRNISIEESNALSGGQFDFSVRNIVIVNATGKRLDDVTDFGDALDNDIQGIAYLDVTKIENSGFDTLKLKTDHVVTSQSTAASEIRFESDIDLSLNHSIVLSAPIINSNNANVKLNAAYVALGSDSLTRNSIDISSLAGEKGFAVDAAFIDIIGDVNLTNTASVNLNASDDIRFIGARTIQTPEQLTGALSAATDVNLIASQIYPASFSQVSINLVNDPSATINIAGKGNATPILSALGSLSINAPNIVQGGTLKAPLGAINLNASESITLLPDSVTSISANDQIIPFGKTTNAGGNWTYTITSPVNVQLADKSVDLKAPNIDIQPNSVVDISGNGDLVAYEFVSGPTGSRDVLLPENAAGAFAILPSSGNQYAPYDFLISNDTGNVGRQVYLEAGNDFAAGYYTVLPARYALLPGAKLVTPFTTEQAIFPGEALTRTGGAAIHAGKYAIANTGIIDSQYSAFVVEDGSVVRTRSEYIETSANQFFAERLPENAGALVINTADSLALAGTILGDHAAGTNGSRLDILANNIEVIVAGSNIKNTGFVQLEDSNLNALAVDSLMLGGKRRIGDAETTVSVRSNNVTLQDNVSLELPEILLVAKNQIETRTGSTINGQGGVIGNKSDNFVLDNSAAILGVTANALPTISRTSSSVGASINLAEGSILASDHSIFVNSNNDVTLNANLLLDGGNLSLGAKNVSLGSSSENVPGLNLSTELMASLRVNQLEVSSVESILINEDINLAFNNLTLTAPGIKAKSDAGTNVQLTASGDVVLRQNGFSTSADGEGSGAFKINAKNIILAGNDQAFVFDGFDEAQFTASQSLVGAGYGSDKAGIDKVNNNVFDFGIASVILDTPLLTGEAGSSLVLNSQSSVALLNRAGKTAGQVNVLGSTLIVNASNLVVDTNLVFPSGLVALNALGLNSGDNVVVTESSVLDTSGRIINYVDGSQAGSSGGVISLTSDASDVEIMSGATVNISASDIAGDSGTLNLFAVNGTTRIDELINTTHAKGFEGASIRIDAGQISDLPAFLQQLQSSNFSQRQNIRLRNGDINLSLLDNNQASIKASEITLTADNGRAIINGKLDASGEKAGRIKIYAADDIDVSGAVLDVFATAAKKGGSVLLATADGQLSVDNNTQINVAGSIGDTRFDSGKVSLRAARTNRNSDVAISNFDAIVTGAERIDIEGFTVYNDALITNAQQTIYRNDAAGWLANKAGISNRLGLVNDNRVHYLAGVEVFNKGDITISDAVDFYQWQLASANVIDEGVFTLRAENNLNINASISDAVNNEVIYSLDNGGVVFDGPIAAVIKNGESWNYRLVSGADLNSVNLLATQNDNLSVNRNFVLAENVAVRTGKGDINIVSGGDLILTDQTSVIYTVGQENGLGRFDASTIDFVAIPDGPQFPDQGGDIRIAVAGDINAAISDQFFTDWLQRYGGVTQLDDDNPIPGMWAIVVNDFEQGIATLGGGDIDITAGGNISNLSISTPQNGQIDTANNVILRGGGDITLAAGGDIRSARLLADGGEANIRARGDVTSDSNGLNTLIALGDAKVNIEAAGNIDIEGIGNITMLPLSTLQSNKFVKLTDTKNTAYFFSYTDRSAVNLLSYYGDITLNNDIEAIKVAPSNRFTGSSVFPWRVYPGEFSATTLSGDIAINNSFVLFPGAKGNLALRAAADIVSRQDKSTQQVFVSVSDVALASLPSIAEPKNILSGTTGAEARLSGNVDPTLLHDANGPLHLNDNQPLSIVANQNITANGVLEVRSPKRAQVIAGNNIRDFSIKIQNINTTDKSLIMAGGDISYRLPDTGSTLAIEGISVTGPGSITVMAGGDIRLGISKGIRSLGNVNNFILPKQGADIAVFAGIANAGLNDELDTTSFISTYFKGELSAAALIDIDVAGYQQQLVDYVLSDQYNGDLTQAVTTVTLQSYASNAQAIVAFNALDKTQQIDIAINSFSRSQVSEQRKLIIDVFTSELNLAAETVAATTDDNEYARGFLAINQLFAAPGTNATALSAVDVLADAQRGDINLPFSRIQSNAGGDINLFAPHGKLNIGFTAEVKNASSAAGSLGVVISGRGNLSAMSDGNINVNLSRVQALDGGDISLWSSTGDIDAGRGAKTALTIPPPLTVVNKESGQIEIIFPAAVSGSGINAGVSSEGLEAGKVTLAAPGGVINASDGGIGSAGDLVVAATKVLGGDNFSAGGATVGVPVATNVTSGLSGLSSSTDNAISSASDAVAASVASNEAAGIALVTVELLAPEDNF